MDLTKQNITKTLEKVNMSGSSDNIVSSGILKNVQVFGDQVDIDIVVSNPALQARKKLEVDIMKIIHDDIYEKAKINVNTKVESPKVDKEDGNEIDGSGHTGNGAGGTLATAMIVVSNVSLDTI